MTEILDKDSFEREWANRQAALKAAPAVEPSTNQLVRFVFQGFLEALIGFDDLIGQAPQTPAAYQDPETQLLGRINQRPLRQIAAPKTIRRRLR